MRPLLFVHNHAPPDRVAQYARLHAAEELELALHGGRLHHARRTAAQLPLPHRHIRQHAAFRLAASGTYRAVLCSTNGRLAPFAAYAGARRAGIPFVLWATLWALPETAAGRLGAPLVHRLYRDADAVVTYGEHVSAHVRSHGARAPVAAPQASDGAFWQRAPAEPWREAPFQALWVGRAEPGKGLAVALTAWRRAALPDAALVVVGEVPRPTTPISGVHFTGPLAPTELRRLYAGSDVLLVSSVATRRFREPWALVVNEAMHAGVAVIASDAVGAVAGGLLADGRNGVVVPAGDADALAAALRRLREDPALRARLAATARADVAALTPDAWVQAVRGALALAGAGAATGPAAASARRA
jgi:glycosyltransferase involved in cell wall biosynthesis